ncbi:MAG TPA: hypothetical protein VGA69_12430 [Nitriliruptorales bacterium]
MSDSSLGRERDLHARPSPAFDEGAGGDDAVERVDQLFTQAVERQVAEQRNLNRLLEDVEQQMTQVRNRIDELQKQVAREAGPTLDRLGALDASLRSLRESVSAQSVALRTELQESLEKIRGEARDRAQNSDERVSELREADGRVASEIHDLAQRVETALERVDARQGSISEDLAGLRGVLTDASELAEHDRSSVAPLVTRLQDELADLRRNLESSVGERLDAAVASLQQVFDQDLGALRTRMDQLSMEFERPAESVDRGLRVLRAEILEDLDKTRTAVDASGRLLAESTESMGDEVARVLAQVRGEVDDRVGALVDRVGQLETVVTSRVEESLTAHSDDLLGQVSSLRQELGERLDAQQRDARESRASQRTALDEQAASVRGAADRVRDDVREQLETQAREHTHALAAATEQFRATAGTLTAELGELEALSIQLTQLRAHDAEARDEFRHRLTEDLGAQIQQGVQAAGTRVDEELTRVRARLDDGFSGLRDRMDGLASSHAQDNESLTDQVAERLQRLDQVMTEHIGRFDERLDVGLVSMRARFEEAVERQRAGIEATLAELSEANRVAGEELAGRIDRFDEHLTGQGRTLAGVADGVDSVTVEVADTFQRLQAELLTAQADVLADIRATQDEAEARLERARELLDQSASQVESRAEVLEEQLAQALDRVAERLRKESDEASTELRVAASRLDTTFQHLRHLESSLVAYLEARDRRLEQDRADLLGDVLGELTSGLSKRERRKYTDSVQRAIEALPPPPPAPEPALAREPAPSARPALADLLGDDFDAPDLEPAAQAEPAPDEEPEVVPVPPRKRRSAKKAGESLDGHECPECGFVAKSAGGLGSHRRTHAVTP